MTLLNSTIGKTPTEKKVIGKGIEPHPTNEYHLSILSFLLVIWLRRSVTHSPWDREDSRGVLTFLSHLQLLLYRIIDSLSRQFFIFFHFFKVFYRHTPPVIEHRLSPHWMNFLRSLKDWESSERVYLVPSLFGTGTIQCWLTEDSFTLFPRCRDVFFHITMTRPYGIIISHHH